MDDDQVESIPLKSPEVACCTERSEGETSDLQFLKLVKRNDVKGVKTLLEEENNTDTDACDELGRSTMVIAIDNNNFDMIICLLELNLDPGDALFHAIETHSTKAIETMCNHVPLTRKEEVLNSFPKSQSWSLTTVPLLLAALQDNSTVVQTLIHHGAKIPSLDELRQRVVNDSYGKFLALVNWYEANSNDTFIMLTSNDPMQKIFELGQSLQQLEGSMKVPRFKQECDRIQDKLSALSTKLLNLTRDDKEVELLLNGGKQHHGHPAIPLRIQQALDIGFKDFVSHPSCQDYMVSQWQLTSPYHLNLAGSKVRSALLHLCLILFFYIPCVVYILLPLEKLRLIMKRPFVRFMLHLSSRLHFLLLLVLSTISPMETDLTVYPINVSKLTTAQRITRYLNYKAKPWDVFMILIIIWIVGMTFRTLRQMWNDGVKMYMTKHPWSVLEVMQLFLYWIFIALSVVAYVQALHESTKLPQTRTKIPSTAQPGQQVSTTRYPSLDKGDFNNSRYEWNQFDPLLIAEAAFAIANVLTYLHLLHCLLILEFLGPLLVSFRGMAIDVVKFFIIFIFVWLSFAIGLTQLYRTFEALDYKTCLSREDKTDCPATPFLSFWHSMWSLFWSFFNPIDLKNLAVDEDLYFTGLVGSLLYASFMLMGVVVLLNALIAMMSNTYTRVEENSEVEWKVARTKLMGEYMSLSETLPPPFNLIPSVKTVLKVIQFIRRKCCHGKAGQLRQQCEVINNTADGYEVLSRDLVGRCRRSCKTEQVKELHKSRENQEIDLLRRAFDNISQEMKDLRLQVQHLSSIK